MKPIRRWAFFFVVVAVVLALGAAGYAERAHLGPYADPSVQTTTASADLPDGSSANPADLAAASALEAAKVAGETPSARYQRAADAVLPPAIGSALHSVPPDASKALDGLKAVPWRTDHPSGVDQGNLRMEQAAFSSGEGLVLVSFQDWPQNVDPSILVTEDDVVEQDAQYDVVLRDTAGTPAVTVFDGRLVVSIHVYDEPSVGLKQLRALAEGLFKVLASSS